MGNRVSSFPFPELFTMFLWINNGLQNHISYFFFIFSAKISNFWENLEQPSIANLKVKKFNQIEPPNGEMQRWNSVIKLFEMFRIFLLIPVNLRYFGTLNRASPVFAYSRTSSTEMPLVLLASSVSLTYAATSSPKSSYKLSLERSKVK